MNFASNAETLQLSTEQKQYFADLIYYLENKAGSKVIASGHTDNQGDEQLNLRLSRKRAEFVKEYLIKNGINSQSIQTDFHGSKKPVTSNDTVEGRYQNRRVEVAIQ